MEFQTSFPSGGTADIVKHAENFASWTSPLGEVTVRGLKRMKFTGKMKPRRPASSMSTRFTDQPAR